MWYVCEKKKKGTCACCGSMAHITRDCVQRYYPATSSWAGKSSNTSKEQLRSSRSVRKPEQRVSSVESVDDQAEKQLKRSSKTKNKSRSEKPVPPSLSSSSSEDEDSSDASSSKHRTHRRYSCIVQTAPDVCYSSSAFDVQTSLSDHTKYAASMASKAVIDWPNVWSELSSQYPIGSMIQPSPISSPPRSSLLYYQVEVNRMPAVAMFDTGASQSFITYDLADQLQAPLIPLKESLTTIDFGGQKSAISHTVQLSLRLTSIARVWTFYVVTTEASRTPLPEPRRKNKNKNKNKKKTKKARKAKETRLTRRAQKDRSLMLEPHHEASGHSRRSHHTSSERSRRTHSTSPEDRHNNTDSEARKASPLRGRSTPSTASSVESRRTGRSQQRRLLTGDSRSPSELSRRSSAWRRTSTLRRERHRSLSETSRRHRSPPKPTYSPRHRSPSRSLSTPRAPSPRHLRHRYTARSPMPLPLPASLESEPRTLQSTCPTPPETTLSPICPPQQRPTDHEQKRDYSPSHNKPVFLPVLPLPPNLRPRTLRAGSPVIPIKLSTDDKQTLIPGLPTAKPTHIEEAVRDRPTRHGHYSSRRSSHVRTFVMAVEEESVSSGSESDSGLRRRTHRLKRR